MKNLLLAALPLLAACSSTPEPTAPSSPPPSAASTTSAPAPAAAPADTTAIESAIKARDAAKASQLAGQAIAKNPKDPRAHYYAGVAAEQLDDKAAAEKHYREALALAPGFGEAAANLTVLLLASDRAADAVALLKPLVARAPDDVLLQSNYAAALASAGDEAGAGQVYTRLLARGPVPPDTRLDYAAFLLGQRKKDEAARVLRDGLASVGDDRDQLAAFGRALGQAGAFDDAIKALDRAIQIKADADLLAYRGLFKRSLKNLEGARADLEAAIRENPKHAGAHRYLGEVLEDMKKPADAKKAYESAIAADPRSPHSQKARERLDALKGGK